MMLRPSIVARKIINDTIDQYGTERGLDFTLCDQAQRAAIRAYLDGAHLEAAIEEGRRYLRSYTTHPAHPAPSVVVAVPTGFEPAMSTVTGWRGRPNSSTGPWRKGGDSDSRGGFTPPAPLSRRAQSATLSPFPIALPAASPERR